MGKLFGTDGVRGIANSGLTPLTAYKIGRATATLLHKEKGYKPTILLGMDTRISGPMLGAALSAGVCSAGGDIIDLGVIPTPAAAYLIRQMKADAGVVITASHNPVEYNGIKIFNSQGFKLRDELENEIEEIVLSESDVLPSPTGHFIGSISLKTDSTECYANYIAGIFKGIDLSGIKIALDCAEGATFTAAPMIFEKLGAKINIIHNTPTGLNINEKCGSTHLEELGSYVRDNNLDIGIAFDGDGDRCLLVSEKGVPVDGDEIMSICACFMKGKGKLKGNTLVATVMSNLGLFIMGDEIGINIEKTAVGDRYVLERMLEIDANIGGEQSGHVIFLEHNTTGDGILTALNILSIMAAESKSISELNTKMRIMPQILIGAKVDNSRKYDFNEVPEIQAAIERLEGLFAGRGRVLIRASGTEPLVRIMIEGEDREQLEKEAGKMKELIEKHLANGK